MVCRLHKALYGLKQAPRAWYERLHKYLVKIGFKRNDDNNNLYIKTKKDYFARDLHKKKELTMERHFPLLQNWKEQELYLLILHIKVSKFIKWMLSLHFLMVF